MFTYLLSLFAPASQAAQPLDDGVAHQLLERAGSRAGTSAHEAQELRSAAQAYLSVVR